jgi:hypothetical protein
VIWSFGDDGRELLVNEIGRVSGESMLAAGSRYVEIKADGAWTFARK